MYCDYCYDHHGFENIFDNNDYHYIDHYDDVGNDHYFYDRCDDFHAMDDYDN